MSDDGFKAPPIAGYQDVSGDKAAIVNENKAIEERLLRRLDKMIEAAGPRPLTGPHPIDHRWMAIARSHFEEGFMAMNRAVFQPQRIKLPEDNT